MVFFFGYHGRRRGRGEEVKGIFIILEKERVTVPVPCSVEKKNRREFQCERGRSSIENSFIP